MTGKIMLKKICRKCGRTLPQGEQCHCRNERHKLYNKTVRDKSKNDFYHSKEWAAVVEKVKARANGLDEYALSIGQLIKGNTVHHIYPIDERPDLRLSIDNLIYVSPRSHGYIHGEYAKSPGKKEALQSELKAIAIAGGGG